MRKAKAKRKAKWKNPQKSIRKSNRVEDLDDRQLEAVRLLGQRMADSTVAKKLHVSRNTLKNWKNKPALFRMMLNKACEQHLKD